VLTNFLNIWVLVRLVQAATAAGLGWVGMVVGLRIAVRWREGQSSETQLALERRAELVGSVMQVALLLEVLGLALTLQVADHLVGGIRGAMCAFGVLASTWAGWPSLWTSVVTAVACAVWVIFHRLDLSLPSPVLTRRKFFALGIIGPLVTADLVLTLVFIHSLDFSVVASCCSVWVDDTLVNEQAARWVVSPGWAGGIGLVAAMTALVVSIVAWRRPQSGWTRAAALLSTAGSVAVLPAVLGVVAPHVLGVPGHLCPFCLFHAQGYRIGWPLFAALFVAAVCGIGLGLVELNRRAVGEQASLEGLRRRLAGGSALAWVLALVCGLFPVVRYYLASGGVSVFGEL
jgi:hypothetical protein